MDLKHAAKPIVSNSKGNTGHLMFAAGGAESMFAIKQLETGIHPPIMNLENPCDDTLNFVIGKPTKQECKYMLKTGLGMGGNCAALLFKKD